MELISAAPVLALGAGDVVTLDDARGVRIEARTGTVWVTEEANPRDHILVAGQALVVSRAGRTLIQAMQPAWIALQEAANQPLEGAAA